MNIKKIVDLTMGIREGMPQHMAHGRSPLYLSGTRQHQMWKECKKPNPYDPSEMVSFQNEQIVICGHMGTHMDACFHADPLSKQTIEQMPLDRGYGTAVWLDVSFRRAPRVAINPEDLAVAENKSDTPIQPDDIVLVYTGWSTIIEEDPAKYSSDFMGLSKEAGEWLRAKKVKTVGLDTCNIDAFATPSPVHMNFLRPRSLGLRNEDYIAIIENLVNINKIPTSRFHFVGVPLPFLGSTGSPIRAFAVLD
jgi:kynurenine formamidase